MYNDILKARYVGYIVYGNHYLLDHLVLPYTRQSLSTGHLYTSLYDVAKTYLSIVSQLTEANDLYRLGGNTRD